MCVCVSFGIYHLPGGRTDYVFGGTRVVYILLRAQSITCSGSTQTPRRVIINTHRPARASRPPTCSPPLEKTYNYALDSRRGWTDRAPLPSIIHCALSGDTAFDRTARVVMLRDKRTNSMKCVIPPPPEKQKKSFEPPKNCAVEKYCPRII